MKKGEGLTNDQAVIDFFCILLQTQNACSGLLTPGIPKEHIVVYFSTVALSDVHWAFMLTEKVIPGTPVLPHVRLMVKRVCQTSKLKTI